MDIPSPPFQPPFICKTPSGFWTFSIILYGRGGPMCPPNDPNNLKWTVLGQTHGSAPTENGRLKRCIENTQGIAEGRLWRDLESTAEGRMKGCAVIFNRLIAIALWLKCKDERRRGNDRSNEGILPSAPTWKTHRAFLKTSRSFCILQHVRMHRATHTVA